jgi:hypothetical protein
MRDLKNFAVILVFGTIILFIGARVYVLQMNENEKIDNSNNTETIELERSKDFSVIKIIKIVHPTAVDAFGDSLREGEWYVQSNVTRSVFPINTKSTNYTKLDWLMNNGQKELARIQITNGTALGAHVDVELLLLGNQRVVLNDLQKYQVVSIK